MIINFIAWCLFGLLVGGLARLLLPGRDPMGYLATIGLGIAGSFAMGIVFHVLFSSGGGAVEPSGYIGSILGAIGLLMLVRSFRSQGSAQADAK